MRERLEDAQGRIEATRRYAPLGNGGQRRCGGSSLNAARAKKRFVVASYRLITRVECYSYALWEGRCLSAT